MYFFAAHTLRTADKVQSSKVIQATLSALR